MCESCPYDGHTCMAFGCGLWAEVDAYERALRARGLDHVPARIELPREAREGR